MGVCCEGGGLRALGGDEVVDNFVAIWNLGGVSREVSDPQQLLESGSGAAWRQWWFLRGWVGGHAEGGSGGECWLLGGNP